MGEAGSANVLDEEQLDGLWHVYTSVDVALLATIISLESNTLWRQAKILNTILPTCFDVLAFVTFLPFITGADQACHLRVMLYLWLMHAYSFWKKLRAGG